MLRHSFVVRHLNFVIPAYPFIASTPPRISMISPVIWLCRARL
jgi:hypothetical protein